MLKYFKSRFFKRVSPCLVSQVSKHCHVSALLVTPFKPYFLMILMVQNNSGVILFWVGISRVKVYLSLAFKVALFKKNFNKPVTSVTFFCHVCHILKKKTNMYDETFHETCKGELLELIIKEWGKFRNILE